MSYWELQKTRYGERRDGCERERPLLFVMKMAQCGMMQLMTTDSKVPFGTIQGVRGEIKKSSQRFQRGHVSSMRWHELDAALPGSILPLLM